MVVEYGHNLPVPESLDDRPEDVLSCRVLHKGILLDHLRIDLVKGIYRYIGSTGGSSERVLNTHGGVQRMVNRVCEPDAVEALLLDEIGDEFNRLLVEAFGDIRLHMPWPVDTPEFDPIACIVQDPPAFGLEGEFLGKCSKHKAQRANEKGELHFPVLDKLQMTTD